MFCCVVVYGVGDVVVDVMGLFEWVGFGVDDVLG